MGALSAVIQGILRQFIYAAGVAWVTASIKSAVEDWLQSGDGAAYITGIVNSKLQAHGVDLHLSNILDKEAVLSDLDSYAAGRINAKLGTEFSGLRNLDRETALTEVSRVLAARVNTATGAHLAVLWPVDRLREELGTELARQFDPGVDLSPGGLFPQAALQMVQARIARRIGALTVPNSNVEGGTVWGPPRDEKHALERARSRARSAKYRKTHRQTWVQR
ncbi:MAG: hypothetical protein KF740_19400 [Ramlibacter sp.]|nr:hypothetical protein [Ramlibacter sp.]